MTKTRPSDSELRELAVGILVEASPQVLLVDHDLKIAFLSRYEHGYSPETVIGRPVEENIPPDQRILVLDAVKRALRDGEASVYETDVALPGGGAARYRAQVAPVRHDGRITHASILSSDVTSEREAERLAADLAQAQKLQAMGQLTGGVAHDFNNLLTVIDGSAALVAADPADRSAVQQHARDIRAAVDRAADLTQRLLAFSRKVPLRPQTVAMGELVGRMRDLLVRTLGETIEVETQVAVDVWPCHVDPAQYENALLNLAINARDSMSSGGLLRIEVENVSIDGESANTGDFVRTSVIDEGCGIAAEDLAKVVEPFFTTKDVGQGSGLGLSMVYGFAEQSGGRLTITSELGRGTRVALDLPRTSGPARPSSIPARPADVTPVGNGETLLVVEDEALLLKVVERFTTRLGFDTITASTAHEALALLEARPDISLVLSDIVLPGGLNGVAMARRARTTRQDLPFVFMSGYTADAHEQLEEGAVLLDKPFTLAALADALRTALASR